ncbi:MAG: hypothetical protein Q4F57_04320 [Weeksellaceae bacterium]|nr:hypothetical protein [Weeksellaceae bacterium]
MRNLLIITLLTINSFSSAQPQDVMLPIMSSWSIGDHFDFTIDRYTHEVVHSQVIQDKHLTFHSQMRILDASEKSYTILWMYDYDWSAFEGQLSPKYFDNLRKFSKVEIIYKTDQYGTYEQLLNADEINSQFTDMYENLIASLPDTVDMKDVRALAELTNMQHMMSNEEYVEQTFLKDVFLVHYLLGVVLDPKIKNTYVQSFPSLGGQTVFGNAELEVVHINPEQFFCVIEENVTLSEEDSQRFVSSYLQKVGGAQAVQKLNKWDFDIRDQHEFQLFYYPGIPKKITTKRTIAISDSKEFSERTDTTVIQLRIPQE